MRVTLGLSGARALDRSVLAGAGPGTLRSGPQAALAGRDGIPCLSAYMLGAFRLLVDERPVEAWPSRKGRSLCKYLLVQGAPTPRDVLMDVFWRHARPDSARNCLNVALHGLRRALLPLLRSPSSSIGRGRTW